MNWDDFINNYEDDYEDEITKYDHFEEYLPGFESRKMYLTRKKIRVKKVTYITGEIK